MARIPEFPFPKDANEDGRVTFNIRVKDNDFENGDQNDFGGSQTLNCNNFVFRKRSQSIGQIATSGCVARKKSLASIRSIETLAPPPSSIEEKNVFFWSTMTINMSIMYAIFLLTLGMVFFLGELVIDSIQIMSVYFNLYLILVGFVYLVFILIDIHIQKKAIKKHEKVKDIYEEHRETIEDKEGATISIPVPEFKIFVAKYYFRKDSHGCSFYLKLGATGFALGHLVHSILLICSELDVILQNGRSCIDVFTIIVDVSYPTISFFQLYFIFKNANVIIASHQVLGYFGLMHFVGSSVCFWLRTIINEIMISLQISSAVSDSANDSSLVTDTDSTEQNSTVTCENSEAFVAVMENFSPYLYPFTIEYSILMAGVFYNIWCNIDKKEAVDDFDRESVSSYDTRTTMRSVANDSTRSRLVIHADCHSSNKGIFGGILIMVMTLAVIVLGFIFIQVDTMVLIGNILGDVMELTLHLSMLIAAIFAYRQLKKMDIERHDVPNFDKIMLLICIPAFFLETIFILIASVALGDILIAINSIVMSIQVVIQSALLMDGLRRCSNTRKLRRTKPGRELIMFLLISNVAMWIFTTFSHQLSDSHEPAYEYYGKFIWSIISHAFTPICMFFRFHSSVCFAHIWKSAYDTGSF